MNFKQNILPEKKSKWRQIAIVLIGIVTGLGFFMAKEASLVSYMSDDPLACVNCHVMTPMYNSWMHSSHREQASCNDCHVPHDNVFNKYFFKAKDGLFHATIFTARAEPEVMFMREASQEVVQKNCIRCHIQQVTQTKYDGWLDDHRESRTERKCWSCHQELPHGTVHGISTIKNNIAPIPTDQVEAVIPEWLNTKIEQKK
ncbi:cytochrome c nitrite reductase small subunit [Tenacibaculum finnmarkense genomovar finnmarkense]|uniref:cytochrome c nitrite reductase small subunit n=1 Tax=Tenacibaculum finnmarkense TaxID=2781243 RepID=UPI001E394595|nr:cytochrome c nitrite reductase small subunit [Tenacibaculum finnmarkense]MCD8416838.1 cytochrome c nitrite reductase small subunit [Tenacibaculum finnmarkense genomovar finnmarkense]MCG8185524.1 cytochrome c nitrite reductase small subunit [Tenacibaculum finnmarkense genomovar finnmarkense]MCG8201906.1 cytochrome c nitrite reductase small subunit [Tenacibaculum finnmarkense genomovar finnmarkense]MCG8209345.1 cytochrome c nitrite reductase small subunit [Tenacibaculum finnmarkense genomovar 